MSSRIEVDDIDDEVVRSDTQKLLDDVWGSNAVSSSTNFGQSYVLSQPIKKTEVNTSNISFSFQPKISPIDEPLSDAHGFELLQKYLEKLLYRNGLQKERPSHLEQEKTWLAKVNRPFSVFNDFGVMRVNLRGLPADRRMLCKLRSNVQTKQMRGFKSAHFQKDQEMVVASVFQDDPFYVIAFAETKMTKNRQLPEVEAHRFESYNMKPCFDLYPQGSASTRCILGKKSPIALVTFSAKTLKICLWQDFRPLPQRESGYFKERPLSKSKFTPASSLLIQKIQSPQSAPSTAS